MKEKSLTEHLVSAIMNNKNIAASKALEKVLKAKCAKRIKETLKS